MNTFYRTAGPTGDFRNTFTQGFRSTSTNEIKHDEIDKTPNENEKNVTGKFGQIE